MRWGPLGGRRLLQDITLVLPTLCQHRELFQWVDQIMINYFIAKIIPDLVTRNFFRLCWCSADAVGTLSYLPGITNNCCGSSSRVPSPGPGMNHFSKDLWFFISDDGTRKTKIWNQYGKKPPVKCHGKIEAKQTSKRTKKPNRLGRHSHKHEHSALSRHPGSVVNGTKFLNQT